MASNPVQPPFGVSFLSILLMVGGIVDIIVSVLAFFNASDLDYLVKQDVSKSDVRLAAIIGIVLGVIVVMISLALRRGSNAARIFIGVIAALRFVSLIWVAIAYPSIHWAQAFWPTVIYGLVAGYLFFDNDAKAYFEGRR